MTFIDANRIATRAIEKNILVLNADRASVLNLDSLNYLDACRAQFHIVFLDPPFNSHLLQSSINLIDEHDLLNKTGWLYAEYSNHQQQPHYPGRWKLHRQTSAGDVNAQLLQNL